MHKILLVLTLVIAITSLITTIVYAYAAYHGNWAEQPYLGNWWWYNYGYLYWDVDDLWTPSGVNALRSGHNGFPRKEYRFEQEAYNPGQGSSCDRLSVYAVYTNQPPTWNLPTTSYKILNGCGSNAIKELVHLELDENSINANVWYRHRVIYVKQNPGNGGDGEVNYSFSHNWTWSDSWLGKLVYDRWFNKKYSDPPGLAN